jgi:hypothetical protein
MSKSRLSQEREQTSTPGPGEYRIDLATEKVSLNGGTGSHNSKGLRFSREIRSTITEIAHPSVGPGPGYYYNGHQDSVSNNKTTVK